MEIRAPHWWDGPEELPAQYAQRYLIAIAIYMVLFGPALAAYVVLRALF